MVGVVSITAHPGFYLPPVPVIRHQLVPIGTIVKTYPTLVSSSRQLLFQQRFGRKLNCTSTTPTTTTTTSNSLVPEPTESAVMKDDAVLKPTTEEQPTTTSVYMEETTDVPETTTLPYSEEEIVPETEKVEENIETSTTTSNEVEEATDLPEATTELPQLKLLEIDLPLEVDNRIADEVELTTMNPLEWDDKDNEIDALIVPDEEENTIVVERIGEDDKEDAESNTNDKEVFVVHDTTDDNVEENVTESNFTEDVETKENSSENTFDKEEISSMEDMKLEEVVNNNTTDVEPAMEIKEEEAMAEEGSGEPLKVEVPEVEDVTDEEEKPKDLPVVVPEMDDAAEEEKPKALPVEVNEMAEPEQKHYAQLDFPPENLLNSYSSAFFHRFANSPFLNIQQHPIQIPVSSSVPAQPLIKSFRPLLHTAAYTAALHPLPVFKKTTTTTTVEQHHHPQHFIHTHDGVALNYGPAAAWRK